MHDHNGDPVSPEDVLDGEELDGYYGAHPERDPRRQHAALMLAWPSRDAAEIRCDRADRHPAHTYVATAKSGVDFHCPGVT